MKKTLTAVKKERLDVFLERALNKSRSQIKKWIEAGRVELDKVVVTKPSKNLSKEMQIVVDEPKPVPSKLVPEEIPLEVIYEDKNIIVINKAAGIIVHPAGSRRAGTLVNALLYHCKDLSGIGGELKPGIVHRLDIGTSGVMVIAKNDESHLFLSNQFQNREVKKIYFALVYGKPPDTGEIDKSIGRSVSNRKKFSSKTRKSRTALTTWKVKERFGNDLAFLEVRIFTGRTHQIRVHLTESGYPIVGDPLYGRRNERRKIDEKARKILNGFKRPALHAHMIGFKKLGMDEMDEYKAKLPLDYNKLLNTLREIYE